ncbi:MAG TPA: NUDIX hydrolase [Rhizobiaceae bacterium]|nr:NUDIX hydrolase [Rhizobiaceae bacterium]
MRHATYNHLMERLRRLFGGMPCHMQVAALPWRRKADGIEVLLVTSRETGRWVLPKGWPEGKEQLCEAAAREAAEEAGIDGVVSQLEAGRYYYGKRRSSGMELRCEVRVFPLEVRSVAEKWPEKKRRRRAWLSPAEAAVRVQEPDLGELITRFGKSLHKSAA